jgi:hypothetical protein
MTTDIEKYVNAFLESYLHKKYKLPLIAFSQDDCDAIKNLLNKKNINVKNITHEKNINVSCQHFPYQCDEVKFEHYDDENFDSCNCDGKKACDMWYINRSYIRFSWSSSIMKHYDNCYNDCCCISTIFNRYVIFI